MWAASPATLPVPLPLLQRRCDHRQRLCGRHRGSDHQGRHRLLQHRQHHRCRQLCGGYRGLCLRRVCLRQELLQPGLCGEHRQQCGRSGRHDQQRLRSDVQPVLSGLHLQSGHWQCKSTSQTATAKTRAEMASADFVTTMNTGMAGTFGSSRYSPALSWQTGLIGLSTPTKGNVNLDPSDMWTRMI